MNLRFFFLSLVTLGLIGLIPQAFAQAGNNNPGGVTAEFNGSVTTAGYYDPYTGNARREIDDIVVPGSIGTYPLKYTRTFSTRGTAVWTHNYSWSMYVRPPDQDPGHGDGFYDGPVMAIQYPNGGRFDTITYDSPWYIDANGLHGALDLLLNCAQTTGCSPGAAYELRRADGGKVLFQGAPTANNYRAYKILDPYGQATTLTYDAGGRLWKVTEPAGRFLEFVYQTYQYWYPWYGAPNNTPPHWEYPVMLSAIRADDGRGNTVETVNYVYEWVWHGDYFPEYVPYLTHANYDDGAQSTYTYVATNSADPSGINHGHLRRVLHTCDDPRYAGPMKQIEYEYVPWTEVYDVGRGQIKAEKNLPGEVVSRTTYPTGPNDPNLNKRTETRGDGPSRTFNYVATGRTWGDFKNRTWTETISYVVGSEGWTITDPRTNGTTYWTEPELGAISKITYPATSDNGITTREYTYTNSSEPRFHSGEKDENGHWTYFDRDAYNRVWQIRYPDGSTEQFIYTSLGLIETHKLRSGGTENFRYDTRGRKIEYWPPPTPSDPNPQDHKTRYTYHDSGRHADRLFMEIDPRNNATAYWYNNRGQVIKVQRQDGYYTQSEYNLDGTLAWTADENHPGAATDVNQRTRYEYDQYKRVRKVTNPLGQLTEFKYGLNPVTWEDELRHTTNNPKFTKSPMGKVTVFGYDENLRKAYQVQAYATADEAWTWFWYDEVGNLTTTLDPRNHQTDFDYDARNRKISMDNAMPGDRNSSGHTMNWAYDGVGNKTRETRADGVFRSWRYNGMNQLWFAYDWRTNEVPTANQTTAYDRDQYGNIRVIVDTKGAWYQFEHDARGRNISQTYPVDATPQARTETWHYDFAGNMDQHVTVAGKTNNLHYDNRNRVDISSWSADAPVTETAYDPASRITSVVTREGGNVITTVSFGYDDANRQVLEEQTLAGYPTRRVETPRDDDGNRASMNVPGAFMARYDYTNRNQLAHIYHNDLGPWFNYSYDPVGNLLKRQAVLFGFNDSVNIPPQWYDPLNRPVMWENTTGGDTFLARSWYQYDTVGREVATWRDEESGRGERFTFNDMNQLRIVRYNAQQVWTGVPQNWTWSSDFTYSPDNLNRTQVNNMGTVTAFSANALNQYQSIGGQSLGYDSSFNLNTYAGATFTHNAQNRLTSASRNGVTVNFTYDGLGRCVRRVVNGTTKILITYDGWKPTVDWDGAGNFKACNVYGAGADELLWRYDISVGNLRFHYDRHGNVTFVLGDSNQTSERYIYDVFGNPTIRDWNFNLLTQSAIGNRFMFQGREWIPELGIYDYRHRHYHPALGRFLETDPIGLQTEGAKLSPGQKALFSPGGSAPEAFSSSEMNLYRYCGDDPVDNSDPLGLETKIYAGGESEWAANYNPTDRTVMVAHGNPRQGAILVVNGKGVGFISAGTLAKDAKNTGFSASKPDVDLSICGAGVGGKGSLAQKVANELYERTGVIPRVRGVDGNTANQAWKNDTTGAVRSDPLKGAPDPKTPGTTGEVKTFTVDPKQKKDK